jgi:hypothetical protein
MGRSEAGPPTSTPAGLTASRISTWCGHRHRCTTSPTRPPGSPRSERRSRRAAGLVLVEIDDVGRFQPGLLAVVGADLAEAMPYHGGDWGRALADAGSPPTTYSRSACNRPRPSRPR